MNPLHRTIVSTILLLLALTACGEIDFKGQDIRITHDVAADAIDLEIVYHGMMAPVSHSKKQRESYGGREAEDLLKAVASIENMAEGARRFMLFAGFLVIDLDDEEKDLRSKLEGDQPEDAKRYLELLSRTTMAEVRISKDDKGRVRGYQRIRFQGAKHFTAALNKALRDAVIVLSGTDGPFMDETAPMLSPLTQLAWIKEAKDGVDWVKWEGTSLVVSMPMDPASATRLLHETYRNIAAEENKHARVGMAEILTVVSVFDTSDGRLTLRLDPGDLNALTLSIPEDDRKYATSLTEALDEKGFIFHGADPKK